MEGVRDQTISDDPAAGGVETERFARRGACIERARLAPRARSARPDRTARVVDRGERGEAGRRARVGPHRPGRAARQPVQHAAVEGAVERSPRPERASVERENALGSRSTRPQRSAERPSAGRSRLGALLTAPTASLEVPTASSEVPTAARPPLTAPPGARLLQDDARGERQRDDPVRRAHRPPEQPALAAPDPVHLRAADVGSALALARRRALPRSRALAPHARVTVELSARPQLLLPGHRRLTPDPGLPSRATSGPLPEAPPKWLQPSFSPWLPDLDPPAPQLPASASPVPRMPPPLATRGRQ